MEARWVGVLLVRGLPVSSVWVGFEVGTSRWMAMVGGWHVDDYVLYANSIILFCIDVGEMQWMPKRRVVFCFHGPISCTSHMRQRDSRFGAQYKREMGKACRRRGVGGNKVERWLSG